MKLLLLLLSLGAVLPLWAENSLPRGDLVFESQSTSQRSIYHLAGNTATSDGKKLYHGSREIFYNDEVICVLSWQSIDTEQFYNVLLVELTDSNGGVLRSFVPNGEYGIIFNSGDVSIHYADPQKE